LCLFTGTPESLLRCSLTVSGRTAADTMPARRQRRCGMGLEGRRGTEAQRGKPLSEAQASPRSLA
jgi:hypothetical protein